MKHLLDDPIFFYAVAYVIFLVVAWFFARKPALDWVDGEIEKIRKELEQAKELRVEAEAALNDAKAKKATAVAQAASIVAHAKEEAARFEQTAAENLKFLLEKHEQHALERIRFMEEDAIAQVQSAAIDMAMQMVRKTLATNMGEESLTKLTDQAIADMPKLATAKAKAA